MRTVIPKPEKFAESFSGIPLGVPVITLTLLKYRDQSRYPNGMNDVSGRDAWKRYSEKALALLKRVDAQYLYGGKACAPLIAPEEERWDDFFLIRYRSVEKFIELVADPDYLRITIHRTAALKDSRLIIALERESPLS